MQTMKARVGDVIRTFMLNLGLVKWNEITAQCNQNWLIILNHESSLWICNWSRIGFSMALNDIKCRKFVIRIIKSLKLFWHYQSFIIKVLAMPILFPRNIAIPIQILFYGKCTLLCIKHVLWVSINNAVFKRMHNSILSIKEPRHDDHNGSTTSPQFLCLCIVWLFFNVLITDRLAVFDVDQGKKELEALSRDKDRLDQQRNGLKKQLEQTNNRTAKLQKVCPVYTDVSL